ncbi:VOC family protein [Sphingomonas canadensis]|uniref:VOC family protein n=1 Tax=Sphingomonas canadensis TaxID=1219257 RepID=A0ABW3H5D4_9SPHN|nr:VOC family protein [Sphingomonas canadensis]MCW3836636.1 VOC family protein [Sphingomonas canadensis]
MGNPHGTPIWYELLTSDPDAAAAFYGDVVGWTCAGFGGTAGGDADGYRVFTAPDGEGVGGLMRLPPPMAGQGPVWLFYIGVDDVDAAAAKVAAGGGAVHMPPTTLEGVGRLAMVTDPGGAAFYLMRGASPEASTAFKRMAPGHGEWNELYAPDDQAALAFYAEQFGWTKEGAMPMGEMGEYSFLGHDGGMIGAVMKAPPGERPRWNHFFRTGQIDAAKARVEAGGGTVTWGPQEVPGGDWVIYATDPQGAAFGLVGNKGTE